MPGPLSAMKTLMTSELLAEMEGKEPPLHELAEQILREEEAIATREATKESMTAIRMAPYTTVTPENVAQLRARVFHTIDKRLVEANDVLLGRRVWSPSQVSLFRALLSKVLPDVHHTEVKVGVDSRQMSELSREELEAIVASNRAAAEKTIEGAAILDEAISKAKKHRKPKAKVAE